tara:strand:+ start:411 stop:620 length:210 start_codon:yes stop_codon:yes gene_type:complete
MVDSSGHTPPRNLIALGRFFGRYMSAHIVGSISIPFHPRNLSKNKVFEARTPLEPPGGRGRRGGREGRG